MIQNNRYVTYSLRGLVVDLQEKFDTATPQGICTPASSSGNFSPQTSGIRTSSDNLNSHEREIVKKGIERLEKQILQFINVFIPQNQTNIALLKKCKTVDVPSLLLILQLGIYRKHAEIGWVQWYGSQVLWRDWRIEG